MSAARASVRVIGGGLGGRRIAGSKRRGRIVRMLTFPFPVLELRCVGMSRLVGDHYLYVKRGSNVGGWEPFQNPSVGLARELSTICRLFHTVDLAYVV